MRDIVLAACQQSRPLRVDEVLVGGQGAEGGGGGEDNDEKVNGPQNAVFSRVTVLASFADVQIIPCLANQRLTELIFRTNACLRRSGKRESSCSLVDSVLCCLAFMVVYLYAAERDINYFLFFLTIGNSFPNLSQ